MTVKIRSAIGICILATQFITGRATMGAERFYDAGFKADLEFLGPERKERLDLYYPKSPAPGEKFPGVVVIHGGGWCGGDKGARREINIGSNLARAGYVCVSINYELFKPNKPSWPQNIYDCKRAVQYLRVNAERLHVDPERIGSIGGSAGGHLAAMIGVCGPDAELEPPAPYPGVSSKVHAAVYMYGLANLLDWVCRGKQVFADQKAMLGASHKENRKLWESASPIFQADANDCPILLLHGTKDTTNYYTQSERFAKRLAEIGLEHECYIIEGAGHQSSVFL